VEVVGHVPGSSNESPFYFFVPEATKKNESPGAGGINSIWYSAAISRSGTNVERFESAA